MTHEYIQALGSKYFFNYSLLCEQVQADWIKYWMYTDDGSYILPK